MSDRVRNVLMVGVGGQGIVTSSDILAGAALLSGWDTKKSEIHGMSQRGGSVFAHVRYGPRVHSPTVPEAAADVLLALEEMETLRWLRYAHAATTVIVAGVRIQPGGTGTYPAGTGDALRSACPRAHVVDVEALERAAGDRRYVNVALLGILSAALDLAESSWRESIREFVPAGHAEANWKAFVAGRETAPP